MENPAEETFRDRNGLRRPENARKRHSELLGECGAPPKPLTSRKIPRHYTDYTPKPPIRNAWLDTSIG